MFVDGQGLVFFEEKIYEHPSDLSRRMTYNWNTH